ncbi:MAG: UDP-N-acetylmuramate--L-alanine ligase [Ktedonobacterales bacterium]
MAQMAEAGEVVSLMELFPDGVNGKRIHAVGGGGSGISAALWLAHERGALVSGCDVAETSMSRLLNSQGITISLGHDPAHVADADLVVVTPAVTYRHPHLPELEAAREQGIPVVKWQALLGYLMTGYVGVSVAGVHGKGSTTSLLSSLAIAGGLDPTCEVGANVIDWGRNVYFGHGRYFINEADEFDYNFLNYHPRVVVLTAVEYDHPEFFSSYEEIREAFVRFLKGMDLSESADTDVPPPTLVLNADSPGCLDVVEQLRASGWPGVTRTFGIESASADVRAEDVRVGGETSFTLLLQGEPAGRVTLQTPGQHYVYNALAAAAAAQVLGVSADAIVPALAAFSGLRRRFQIVEDGDVTFVDDYAHHPHAITLTLETARQRFPNRRIVAVFQPTLYTRLHRFLQPFSEAFDQADDVVIVETQPSREVDTGLVHGNDLVCKIAARPAFAAKSDAVRYGGTYEETATLLSTLRRPGDVTVVMGSGPVNQVIAGARLNGQP